MKRAFLISLALLFSIVTNAQYLVEEIDITENAKELGRAEIFFDLNNPLEFYRLKCANATYSQYIGGESAFKKKLVKNMKAQLANNNYSVNGTFDFIFFIDKEGNLKNFLLKPDVPNSSYLLNDLQNVIKGLNQRWIPASCNGSPIDSKIRLRVNFRTEGFDL